MKLSRRAVCLCLCLWMLFSAQSAAFADSGAEEALDGFFERYEDLLEGVADSLETMPGDKKLRLDGALSDKLKEYDLSTLGPDLAALLTETAKLSDAELDEAIRSIGAAHSIPLVDSQVQQLHDLCRTLEKLTPEQLQEKLDGLKDRLKLVSEGLEKLEEGKEKLEQGKEKLEQGKEKATGFFGWLKQTFRKLGDLLRQLFRLPARD